MPATRVETATLTTTEAAVLALLSTEGERSGYDLSKLADGRSGTFGRRPGAVSTPSSPGSSATGWRAAHAGPGHPARQAAVSHHRDRPDSARRVANRRRARRARDVLPKLFVGALTTPDVVLEHVSQFVADTEERLERLRAIEPSNTNRGHDWFHRHMLRFGIEQAERELVWAAGVARALKRGPR